MFAPYRRPTVAVVGAGVAGCTAAAECAFSGFDTTLFDKQEYIGGHFCSPQAERVSIRQHFRTPYLKLTRTDGSPKSLVRHLEAAVDASDAHFQGLCEVTGAEFDAAEGQWNVTFVKGGASFTESFDVLIRATGEPSPWIVVPGRKNVDADDLHLHYGVDVVGLPNALFVDYDSPVPKVDAKSWAVPEARGDYARRYVRQLEIRGPGALTVKPDKWRVQPGSLWELKDVLSEFDPSVHTFTRASNYAAENRRDAAEHAS